MPGEPTLDEASYFVPDDHLRILSSLYEIESQMVSHTTNIGTRFDVWWSEEEVTDELQQEGFPKEDVESLIDWMWEGGRLVPSSPSESHRLGFERFRTDTCDLIRNSTFTYPRFSREGIPIEGSQSGVTWRVERKLAPDRSIPITEAAEILLEELGSLAESEPSIERAIKLVFYGLESAGYPKLAKFQIKAAANYLKSLISGTGHSIFTAGTGSGKTLAFQIPVLIKLVYDRINGDANNTVYAFVFPRVALAIDQADSLRKLCKFVNREICKNSICTEEERVRLVLDAGGKLADECKAHFGASDEQTGNTKGGRWKPSKNKSQRFLFGGECTNPPEIIVTNPDTVRSSMMYPEASRYYKNRLRGIVLDEIHLYEGMTGANWSNVIRRMTHHSTGHVNVCGVSATVAEPDQHMSNVLGVETKDVSATAPSEEELNEHGIVHHVLHSSREGSQYISNLTNLTSLQQHVRNKGLSNPVILPPGTGKKAISEALRNSRKAIGFADSLHLLGQWRFFLSDAEGIIPPRGQSESVPWRYARPLPRVVDADLASAAEKHCDSCTKCKPSTIAFPEPIQIENIPRLEDMSNNATPITIDQFTLDGEIGITQDCPFFTRGLCWRPMEPVSRVLMSNDLSDTRENRIWSDAISTSLVSSKTMADQRSQGTEVTDANELFLVPINEATRNPPWNPSFNAKRGMHIVANLALSSPSMEVGVDLDNLSDVILFKAIRNVASYRQKVGRAGRERGTDSIAQTLVSFRPLDYMYYQNPSHLLSDDYLDSIPIASKNSNVIRNRAFEYILLHLASEGAAFHILYGPHLTRRLTMARSILSSKRKQIIRQLVKDRSMDIGREEAANAVLRVAEILEFLTMDLREGEAPLVEGSPNSVAGAVSKPSRFNTTQFANKLLKLLDSIQREVPIIMTELGETHRIGLMSNEVVDLLVQTDFIAKPKGKLEDGHEFPFVALKEKITDDLLYKIFTEARNNEKIAGTLNSISVLKNSLDEIENDDLANIDSVIWNKVLMIKYWHMWMTTRRKDDNVLTFTQLVGKFHFALSGDGLNIPKSLYSSSGSTDVELVIPQPEDRGYKVEKVSHDEAIRHYLPGHLSYRESGRPMKTRLYMTAEHNDHQSDVRIDLSRLTAASLRDQGDRGGHELPLLPERDGSTALRAEDLPWGVSESFSLEPSEKLQLRDVRKIILAESSDWNRLNAEQVLLSDDDESPRLEDPGENDEEGNRGRTNLPQTFGISWSKVTSTSDNPEEVTPFDDYGRWKDEDGDTVQFVMDSSITSMFDDITFHRRAKISEFSVGVVRKYTGVEEDVQFWYVDNSKGYSVPSAMGREIDAPALRFELNRENLDSEIEATYSGIMDGSLWIEGIDFLRTSLSEELGIGPFTADHILRMVIPRVPNGSGIMSYFEAVENLTPGQVVAYGARWADSVSETNRGPGGMQRFIDAMEDQDWSDEDLVTRLLTKWTVRSLTHGLGISMLQSGRAFTGCRDEDLGFHVDVKDISKPVIWIYDRTPQGNGATELIRKFFHVPKVLGHLRNHTKVQENLRRHPSTAVELPKLPTRDYFSWLLKFLEPCFNHQSKAASLAYGRQGATSPDTHKRKLSDHIQFLLDSYNDDWSTAPINHDEHSMRVTSFMRHFDCEGEDDTRRRIDNERLKRATESCWTSCPQCLEEMGVSPLGPLVAPLYSNKRLLDRFVQRSLEGSETLSQSELNLATLEEAISQHGSNDIETTPIDLQKSRVISADVQGDRIMRPMVEIEHIHEFVDTESPITEDGKVRMILRTIRTDSAWRKID